MEDERCTLFTFMTGAAFAGVLHILCGLSAWCCPVFPIFSAVLFLLERNTQARIACIHTALISLAVAIMALVPTVIWLIIRSASHASGVFYVFCTIMFAAVLIMLGLLLLAVEVTCGIKSFRKEPVVVPYVTPLAAKIAGKLL